MACYQSPEMRQAYYLMNGIKDAFIWKEGARDWRLYLGDSEALVGFEDAQFPRLSDAKAFASRCYPELTTTRGN